MRKRQAPQTLSVAVVLLLLGCTTATPGATVPVESEPATPTTATDPTASPAATAGTLGSGPEVPVTWVGHSTPSLPQQVRVDGPYTSEIIPERSNGRVVIDHATWQELNLTGFEVLRLVIDGQADIANVSMTNVAQDVPFLDVVDLAGLNPTAEQARAVLDAAKDHINSEVEQFGIRLVLTTGNPGNIPMCNVPVAGWDDLAGLRIRTFGTSLPRVVEAMEAVPVDVAVSEVYSALERGVADCAISGASGANSLKWYEVSSHMYTLPLIFSTGGYFVNLEWWNSLDADVQVFFEEIFAEMEDANWDLVDQLGQDGIDCNAGRDGCELLDIHTRTVGDDVMVEVPPVDEDYDRLRTILREVILPDWVERCGEDCGAAYNEVIAPITGIEYP